MGFAKTGVAGIAIVFTVAPDVAECTRRESRGVRYQAKVDPLSTQYRDQFVGRSTKLESEIETKKREEFGNNTVR